MKIEDKLNLSEDRGQISKVEDSPLKNQADGQLTTVCLTKVTPPPLTHIHQYSPTNNNCLCHTAQKS